MIIQYLAQLFCLLLFIEFSFVISEINLRYIWIT